MARHHPPLSFLGGTSVDPDKQFNSLIQSLAAQLKVLLPKDSPELIHAFHHLEYLQGCVSKYAQRRKIYQEKLESLDG